MPLQIAELRDLIERGSAADRAFADGVIRINREFSALHPLLRDAALTAHAELRGRILGGLRGNELRAIFEPGGDHFVEEVLGIAYPPLDEAVAGPEQIPYLPSGVAEIMHAFDTTKLSAADAFLDVGSGLGKAVMLAELLTGAMSAGLELDVVLHEEATRAAAALGLHARFTQGDARTAPLPHANMVFMYLPFTGTVLETVLARVNDLGPRYLCAGSLDVARHSAWRQVGAGQSWLQVYGSSSVTEASSDAPTT